MLITQTSCQPLTWNSDDGSTYPRSFEVVGIVGPLISTLLVAVAQVFCSFKIPVMGLYASVNTVSDKTRYPYVMRMVQPDLAQERALLEVIATNVIK